MLVGIFSPIGPKSLRIPYPLLRSHIMTIAYSLVHIPIYFLVFPPAFYLYTHHFIPKVTKNMFLHAGYIFAMFFAVFSHIFKGIISIFLLTTVMTAGVWFSVLVKPKNRTHIQFAAFLGVFWGIWLWKVFGGDLSSRGFLNRKVPEYFFSSDTRNVFGRSV